MTNAPRARDLIGLETLPDEILEKVLSCAMQVPPDGEENAQGRELLRALPVVCKKLLTALRRLKMPLGCACVEAGNAEAVRQQANEPGRAWDLGTCKLTGATRDVSALAGCAALHTLYMSSCSEVTDVSGLAGCAALHTLDVGACDGVTDVSGLAGCAALHTLRMSYCSGVTNVSGLAGCAALHMLDMSCCNGVTDVSGLAGCAALHTLDMSGCDGVTDVSTLKGYVEALDIIGKK